MPPDCKTDALFMSQMPRLPLVSRHWMSLRISPLLSWVLVVTASRPIWFWNCSVNQNAPSGPTAIPAGPAPCVVTAYSVMLPAVVMRPILSLATSVNQRAPSRPSVIMYGWLSEFGRKYSVNVELTRSKRPILLGLTSVNQIALSGPATMPHGDEAAVGTGYS